MYTKMFEIREAIKRVSMKGQMENKTFFKPYKIRLIQTNLTIK
jgi:hypothetical protein